MPYDAVRSRTHRNGKQDLILFDGLTDARSIGAKASHQGSRLPSERPRISPDYSGKVPLSRGKINIPASETWGQPPQNEARLSEAVIRLNPGVNQEWEQQSPQGTECPKLQGRAVGFKRNRWVLD
jgi:hypothetical protein